MVDDVGRHARRLRDMVDDNDRGRSDLGGLEADAVRWALAEIERLRAHVAAAEVAKEKLRARLESEKA